MVPPAIIANDHGKSLERGAHKENVTLKERVLHITWAWFEITMSTGKLGIAHERHLRVLGTYEIP